MRRETDFLGSVELPDDYAFGIHTRRAEANFAFSARRLRPDLFAALIQVKQAAAEANADAGLLKAELAEAIVDAGDEVLADTEAWLPAVHPLQGGAGTSTNMAANELLANLALRKLGHGFGAYEVISPLRHVNLSQSTNDAYPTAVRIAVIRGLRRLHDAVEELQKRLQEKEREFAGFLKVGRTELQDAMPLSLGQEFSAWAEAMTRFRWRLNKAMDWVREVNISGTAVGTGINADHRYRAAVVERLRRRVEEPLTLSRNLVDATQNADQLVEVSGLVRTGAVSVRKLASDLRLLSSGPMCGLGEIRLPELQEGSSIMPGKVNPVMAEAAEQVCLAVMGGDGVIAAAAAAANLELCQFLPLIAHTLLENLELFGGMAARLADTVAGIQARTEQLRRNVENSFAVATLLAPTIGHEIMSELVREARERGRSVVQLVRERELITPAQLERLLTPGIMASPGLPLLEDDLS
ncbi:MAG: aspartate ammonia-lyase [Candidatus Aminicenantes bacterium]|nr:aspartate ammonia-lyase [Candidatus Aminicenantes bacterium]